MLMRLSHTYMISEMADHKEGTKILEQWHSEDTWHTQLAAPTPQSYVGLNFLFTHSTVFTPTGPAIPSNHPESGFPPPIYSCTELPQ